MNASVLIGQVAALYIKNQLSEGDDGGTQRYLLDCLTAEQMASVARAIISSPDLSSKIEIKLPQHYMEGFDLPVHVLTKERTTKERHEFCSKPAKLMANVGDDEEQSLKDLTPIGMEQLLAHPEMWVEVASTNLNITDDHRLWWKQALAGLVEAKAVSLVQFSKYIASTQNACGQEGHPIRQALGYSLPSLRIPRDTAYFEALNDTTSRHVSRWRTLYNTAFKKRACYLLKQTPNQGLLEKETLEKSFEKVRDESIPPEYHDIIVRFIDAENGWTQEAISLGNCEWEDIKPLFDGLKREKFNLGKKTREFFDEYNPELLSDDELDYLKRLESRKTTQAEEEDENFYRDRRLDLKNELSIKAKWDRFIYGSPIESEDFLAGLVQCMQALFDQDLEAKQKVLSIRTDKRFPRELKQLNCDAGLFFAFRYKGIQRILGDSNIQWSTGKLFEFPTLADEWAKQKKPFRNRSVAKNALRITFFLELEVTFTQGTTQTYSKQLIWKFNPNSISSELHADWNRLSINSLVACQCHREVVSGKGRIQSVDLTDVKTLLPTYDRDRGSLVSVYKKSIDIEKRWKQNLEEAVQLRTVSPDTSAHLQNLFECFCDDYKNAIREFLKYGFDALQEIRKQLATFGTLLEQICLTAKGDRNRELLLKPLLEIGSIPILDGATSTIVAPWHPLRMAAIANKAYQASGLIKHLLSSPTVFFGDTKLYFEELKAEMEHPYYPEVVLGWNETKPELLSLVDHHLDYSLHESPIAGTSSYSDTDENPIEASNRVLEILKRYLTLHPHEQANLSVALYNCDSARLPQAIVDKVQELHEDDDDLRCQVMLRHREGKKLRDIYEQIIANSDSDVDSFVASEASTDFMARLRIGIMADEAPVPEKSDGPPVDVVFLQDVIARHAELEWFTESATPIAWEEWVPSRWSRRRPAPVDDLKSVVYLCCPVASSEGWAYLTAITTFLKGDWDGNTEHRKLPARQLNFNDNQTRSIFEEVHNLGNWVVNYDELLDRRQLVNQNVKVIRYKQTDTQGRNMLISSNCSTSLLRRMVIRRLKDLNLGLSDEQYEEIAKRFIAEANQVSGDLVLRAAKRGRNASELLGVVLSKFLIENELGTDRRFGWYFLDDYAAWLGQREEQIADIMALSPEVGENGEKRLAVVISEAKYIDESSLSTKKKESQKQLRQTIDRIAKAVFGDPGRLDRDIWLSRFSDMLLTGIQYSAGDQLELSEWRRAIREGECRIYLRGYSHVFVSGPSSCSECSEVITVSDCDNSYQEVFSRSKLRNLVLSYGSKSDPLAVRKDIEDSNLWQNQVYDTPSERVRTLVGKNAGTTEPPRKSTQDITRSPEPIQAKTSEAGNNGDKKSNAALLFAGNEEDNESIDSEEDLQWLREIENRTKGALQQFQFRSKLLVSKLTPNAAILKFQGSAGLTVDQVSRKRTEFLTTHGLQIIAVRAEPGLVSISIARNQRQVLKLKDIWSRWKPTLNGGNLDLLIGVKEDNGELLVYSPKRNAPHALIAGSTGSGKSVLLVNLILSIATTNTPDQAKMVIIDPKQVDFLAFENLPHIDGGIIDEQDQAIIRLNELVEEMNRRYSLLKENRVTNIYDLHKKVDATEKPPIIWVIHDEFAEWMMIDEYKDAVTTVVSRLGVKARAAGIFLIFAAQRPDNMVMPMQLRSNLGNRLILRVDSEGTSEISLGEKGAERLLGKGHMCAKLEGETDLLYAQVPFVTDEEIMDIVSRIE